RGPFAVTLVDQSEHHLFQPLLYQCATGILSEGQITAPIRRLMRKHANVECLMARAVDLDARARVLTCQQPMGPEFGVPYDYLIVAAGGGASYLRHAHFRPRAARA